MLPIFIVSGISTDTKIENHAKSEKKEIVSFRDLRRAGIKNINAGYFDFTGKIQNKMRVDWNAALTNLWKKKMQIDGVSGAAKNAKDSIIEEYAILNSEKMTINDHIEEIDNVLPKVKESIDWGKICLDNKLSFTQCFAFVNSASDIDGNMLTAYSMTELMPYTNGEQNYQLASIYFESAGRNFLDRVPSLGDALLSLGRYQFTSFAVGVDKDGPRAANVIASYSLDFDIPDSVSKIHGIDSDVTAFYFATHNILKLIKSMSDEDANTFLRQCLNKSNLVQYIATSHHNPKWAKKRAIEWIEEDCTKPLLTYQGKALKVYSGKTIANYNAILEHRI
jgi:hypothetical protein